MANETGSRLWRPWGGGGGGGGGETSTLHLPSASATRASLLYLLPGASMLTSASNASSTRVDTSTAADAPRVNHAQVLFQRFMNHMKDPRAHRIVANIKVILRL